jgi:acylpyruvate hydrolase
MLVAIGSDGRAAGYCVANDVSARDLQKREPQWVRAKGADTFCPYGPWLTTADEVPDPGNLALRTWVNGDLRQDSNTSNLVFGVDELIDFIGQTCTLRPGDLILTGTPGGVGQGMQPPRYLQSGDTITIEIDQLGSIEHSVA